MKSVNNKNTELQFSLTHILPFFSGRLLADLPVEPRLGKAILFSVVLKCLDPVVVLACAMSYKDPCKHCFPSVFCRFALDKDCRE